MNNNIIDIGQNNNVKYGYEVVLDSNKNIVTNSLNAGTYNYPKLDGVQSNSLINSNFLHFRYDVLPYYNSGNSKEDPTNIYQRLGRNFYLFNNKK